MKPVWLWIILKQGHLAKHDTSLTVSHVRNKPFISLMLQSCDLNLTGQESFIRLMMSQANFICSVCINNEVIPASCFNFNAHKWRNTGTVRCSCIIINIIIIQNFRSKVLYECRGGDSEFSLKLKTAAMFLATNCESLFLKF